jgi:glycosyltransferase involved in cell wall biosynthesis
MKTKESHLEGRSTPTELSPVWSVAEGIEPAAKGKLHVLQVMASAIVGGMETYVRNLIRLMASDRFRVTCLCPYESPITETLRSMGAAVFVARMDDDPPWRSIQAAVEITRNFNVDLIHAHLPKAHVLAGLAGALTHTPAIATVHGNTITTHELGIHRTTNSHLIAVCQEAYMQALAMGVAPDKVTLINNGVDLDIYRPSERLRAAFRASLGVGPQTPLIGFVGRIDVEKGPDQFLQAAQVIHAEAPHAHFVMVGTGHQHDRMRQMTAEMGLSDVMHFAGLWADTSKVYPGLDLLLLTSRIEGMPLSLLEAMACEVPVVALGVGGVPEIVEEGRTGMLTGPGDWRGVGVRAIDLLEHPERLTAMGEAARARVRAHFDLRATVAQTTRLMEALVQRNLERGAAPVDAEQVSNGTVAGQGPASAQTR